ncbi:MAG: hypothetical protein COA49_06250 [Bacteroidetes bacterium]|nr:MAG: hypothetical protein COA49_06250 [Bacteroidota bacterium]
MGRLVRPFRLVQPPRHLAHLVASRSYLSYNINELQDKLERNPYSYLQVINPDATNDINIRRGTIDFFREVRKEYDKFLEKGWFEGTDGAGYAIYRQVTPEATYTGIIAVLDLVECESGGLLTHELTLEKREELFATYMQTVGFHAEPILCARNSGHKGEQELDRCISELLLSREADCDFSTTDCIRHSVWWVNPELEVELDQALGPLDKLYLADGHHRLASSIKMMHRNPNEPGVDRILAFILPARKLSILGYHREIRDLDFEIDKLLDIVKQIDSVYKVEALDNRESCPGCIDIISNQGDWRIILEKDIDSTRIDAGWLGDNILGPLFKIEDPRNDPNLKYISGSHSKVENYNKLKSTLEGHSDRIIFSLHPVHIDQIINISNAGKTLPPKSTWIEPKLRSGLFVYEFGMHPHPQEG